MNYHLLSAALFLPAVALYALGASSGTTFLLLLGTAVEIVVWVRVLRPPRAG
jgi:hypothetical protein